jgi:hypothetical protein
VPYTQTSLNDLCTQIGTLLDDTGELFWTRTEKQYAIWEALRVWGAITSFWRARGTFQIGPATPWYDLSTQLPLLRSRSWTLNQMTQEIQYMLLEAANGISGTGMSGQISIASILNAIKRARNRFAADTKLPLTVHPSPYISVSPPNGLAQLPSTTIYLHRLSWRDVTSGMYSNLWREDSWAADHANYLWPLTPGAPVAFSESENSPLAMQLMPNPLNSGTLEAVTVDSLTVDTTNANATFNVPDEFVHGIKYAALADLMSSESQLADPPRAQYAETRYQQAVDAALLAKSIIRVQMNGSPLPLDTLANIDAGMPYWRNQAQQPSVCGALSDLLAFAGKPDRAYGIVADVVRAAPLPGPTDPIQIGAEDLAHLVDYVIHVLCFKCGGNEFQSSFAGYDSFLTAAGTRNRVLAVKARYLTALFGQPAAEEKQRPDRMEKPKQ